MSRPLRSGRTPWSTVIVLCGNCARKMNGGYGANGNETLRTALKAELRATGSGRGVRVLETRCMGLCPPAAVAALNASQPDGVVIIPRNMEAADALARLAVRDPAASAGSVMSPARS